MASYRWSRDAYNKATMINSWSSMGGTLRLAVIDQAVIDLRLRPALHVWHYLHFISMTRCEHDFSVEVTSCDSKEGRIIHGDGVLKQKGTKHRSLNLTTLLLTDALEGTSDWMDNQQLLTAQWDFYFHLIDWFGWLIKAYNSVILTVVKVTVASHYASLFSDWKWIASCTMWSIVVDVFSWMEYHAGYCGHSVCLSHPCNQGCQPGETKNREIPRSKNKE